MRMCLQELSRAPAPGPPGDVLLRYARAVDTRDWDLLETCFSREATVTGTLREDAIGPYLDFLRDSLERFSSTMHVISNQYVTEGPTPGFASMATYAVAYHVAKESADRAPTLTMGVVYEDELALEGGRWKIRRRRVVPKWVQGSVPEPAAG
jgi:3-phenylpropionate/cinnamic acid dioxygenase small subunit